MQGGQVQRPGQSGVTTRSKRMQLEWLRRVKVGGIVYRYDFPALGGHTPSPWGRRLAEGAGELRAAPSRGAAPARGAQAGAAPPAGSVAAPPRMSAA